MFVSRFQKNLVILYQSGETQIWFLINVLGAFYLGLITIITTVMSLISTISTKRTLDLPILMENLNDRSVTKFWHPHVRILFDFYICSFLKVFKEIYAQKFSTNFSETLNCFANLHRWCVFRALKLGCCIVIYRSIGQCP